MVLDSLRHFSDLTHLLFWAVKRTYCTPHGAQQATNAGEARGICRLLQTSSPQATDKLSQHTSDGDFGSCSCAAYYLASKV